MYYEVWIPSEDFKCILNKIWVSQFVACDSSTLTMMLKIKKNQSSPSAKERDRLNWEW